MRAVIDTNVLLIANGQHADVSAGCVTACIDFLQAMQADGITVLDDGFRILEEYHHKTQLNPPKGVGDVFLKFLLRNVGNISRVEQVAINELAPDHYAEFPDAQLQARFDAPDRKFVAVANAHPGKPVIRQAADCKWLDWWPALLAHGIAIDFLCPEDTCVFYRHKFPDRPTPRLPATAQDRL